MGSRHHLFSASIWLSKKKQQRGFFAHTHELLPILLVVWVFCRLTPHKEGKDVVASSQLLAGVLKSSLQHM